MDPLAWQLAIDPPRGTTREERAWRRAEEAAERENRALEKEQREMTSAATTGVRHRDCTVRVREGFGTSRRGGIGAGVLLRIWLKQGKEKRLLARILEKARKRLSRQNSTKKCVSVRKKYLNSTKSTLT